MPYTSDDAFYNELAVHKATHNMDVFSDWLKDECMFNSAVDGDRALRVPGRMVEASVSELLSIAIDAEATDAQRCEAMSYLRQRYLHAYSGWLGDIASELKDGDQA